MNKLILLSVVLFSTSALSQDLLGDLEQRFSFETDTSSALYDGPLDYNRPYQAAGPLQNAGPMTAANPVQYAGPVDTARFVVNTSMPAFMQVVPYTPIGVPTISAYLGTFDAYQPSSYVMFDPNISVTPTNQSAPVRTTSYNATQSYNIGSMVLPPVIYNPTAQRSISPN